MSTATAFQDPLPDRSLCYGLATISCSQYSSAFSILCRIVPSATYYQHTTFDRSLKHFQDPLPDRSLCYAGGIDQIDEVEQQLSGSSAGSFPLLLEAEKRQAPHIRHFQDPLPDRSLCYTRSREGHRAYGGHLSGSSAGSFPLLRQTGQAWYDRLPVFQYPLPDRSLCYSGALVVPRRVPPLSVSSAGSFPLLHVDLARNLAEQPLSGSSAGSFPLLHFLLIGWWAGFLSFSILCRIVPSATECKVRTAQLGANFQYPLPDRSLCYRALECPTPDY